MVDIERKGITLNDWTKGISVDEYAGGSYFYAEGIQSDYCTKGFKLGKLHNESELNSRNSGYPVAISPIDGGVLGTMVCFESDGRIETNGNHDGISRYDGDDDGGGAIFARRNSPEYTNGIIYGDYAIGIAKSKVDKVQYNLPYDDDDELVTDPILSSPGASWTVGTGWTITDDGAKHTPGSTGTLSCSITLPEAGKYRVAICIRGATNGRVTITGFYTMRTESKKNGRFVFNSGDASAGAVTLTITPESSFDGYVTIVNVHEFINISENIASITYNDTHPICLWQGDLYIGSGNKIDVLNLTYFDVETKSIIDETYNIVDITQQAGNLIIWATDGFSSKQYYRNGVDATASEVIEWDGLAIKGVASTETVSYVLTLDDGIYRVYAVNGYQRSLLSISKTVMEDSVLDRNSYNKDKKFVMNLVESPNSMDVIGDNLYIPGCRGLYKYGTEVPGMPKAWNRISVDSSELSNIVLGNGKRGLYMAYTKNDWNYIMYLNEYTYNYSGYVVTNPIYWDKIGTRKSIEKLKIGYVNSAKTDVSIYAIVDDNYFWRYKVTGVTNRPEIGDIYQVATQTNAKIISIEKTNSSTGIITLVTVSRKTQDTANRYLSRVTGSGDAAIDSDFENDNMFLIKKITNEDTGYYSDFIFGENFVDSYIPYWHKIQFVIELNSKASTQTPEVYELSMTADIADTTI